MPCRLIAQTGFNNRDSLGDASLIAAGDNHWTVAGSGARVKVAFGDYDDGTNKAASPQPLPTPVTLLDIALDANQSFKYPIATGTNAFMLVVNQAEAVSFGREGGTLEITATIKSHIAVFLGQPLNEPVVRHGPFAMTNQADINRAIADYDAGCMGSLS